MAMCWLIENFLWPCLPGLLSWCVPMESLLILEAGIMGFVWEKCEGEDLCDLLGLGSVKKGDTAGFHYRAGDETRGLDLGEQRERRSSVSPPGFLACLACGLAGGACWKQGPG